MKRMLSALALGMALCCQAQAADSIKGVIGDADLRFRASSIAEGRSMRIRVDLKDAALVRVREIYPDTPTQPRYQYDLLIGNRLVYRRDHTGTGFGPVSYLVSVPAWARAAGEIRISNTGKQVVRVTDVQPVSAKDLDRIERDDSFGLFGMVGWSHGATQARAWLDELASKMPTKRGFYRGYATEFPYARWTDDQLSQQMTDSLAWAKEHRLAFLPMFISWWAGTPMGIPDGEGGTFVDPKYQQVCWSPEHNADDSPELRKLLGDRWNPHYCLSIPNEWSDTPWLTMNSQKLNAYRHQRLDSVLSQFCKKLDGTDVPISGVCLENEPRYWDTACEAGNPKRDLTTVWGDFNPLVVADAAKAGVNLDPADGLDARERMWLHRNVARYNQNTVDQALKTLKTANPALCDRVYTHSLQLVGFPGDTISHPMSEWAYAKGAASGLEGFWMRLSDLDRVREWGTWSNINREETDGCDIGMHIWDLRVTYARGGRLYNSFNWYAIGSDRFFAYVRDFLSKLPSVEVSDPKVVLNPSGNAGFTGSLDIQSINHITAQVNLSSATDGALLAEVTDPSGVILGFARAEGPFAAGPHKVDLSFATPIELTGQQLGTVINGTLSVRYEKAGSMASPKVETLIPRLDLRRERTQSLWVIDHAR